MTVSEIRQECSWEADRFVEAITDYEDNRNEGTKEIASAKAIELIKCVSRSRK